MQPVAPATDAPATDAPAPDAPALAARPGSELAKSADLWARTHSRPPRALYHYTTGDGLLGILKGGRLWATNARFMNDPSEIQYAADLVQHVLGEAAKKHEAEVKALDAGWMDRLFTAARDRAWKAPKIQQWAENAIRAFDDEGGAYITCFCREPDLLSQWRGYGAVGGGYAVGFTAKELVAKSETVLLRRVIYDPKKQRATVERWVNAIFALDLEWRLKQKQLLREAKRGVMKDWQTYLAAFQGKTEEQIALKESAKKGLAVLNEGLERFSAGKLPICGISYGPVLESGMVARSLKTVLRAMGYDHVVPHVERSKVPYRG